MTRQNQAVRVATQCAPALSCPRGRPSASRAAEQTQRSSTFPRRIRSHADSCSRLTGRLHGTIVGPTGLSDWSVRPVGLSVYTFRSSDRPVGPTQATSDCLSDQSDRRSDRLYSRTAHICQSNQCGLLADYNTAYAATVIGPTGQSDQSR